MKNQVITYLMAIVWINNFVVVVVSYKSYLRIINDLIVLVIEGWKEIYEYVDAEDNVYHKVKILQMLVLQLWKG